MAMEGLTPVPPLWWANVLPECKRLAASKTVAIDSAAGVARPKRSFGQRSYILDAFPRGGSCNSEEESALRVTNETGSLLTEPASENRHLRVPSPNSLRLL
jgi:hypothetical protein